MGFIRWLWRVISGPFRRRNRTHRERSECGLKLLLHLGGGYALHRYLLTTPCMLGDVEYMDSAPHCFVERASIDSRCFYVTLSSARVTR